MIDNITLDNENEDSNVNEKTHKFTFFKSKTTV